MSSNRQFTLFLLSTILLSLAFNFPQVLGFFCLFFLIPILYYIDKTSKSKDIYYKKDIIYMSFFTFTTSFASTYWIYGLHPMTWSGINDLWLSFTLISFFWVCLSFFFSIPMLPFIYLRRLSGGDESLMSGIYVSVIWPLLEYFRAWLFSFGVYGEGSLLGPDHTYYSITYLTTQIPILRECTAFGGIYFTSFLIILINYLIYKIITRRSFSKELIFILLTIIASYSIVFFIKNSDQRESDVNIFLGNSKLPSSTTKGISDYKAELAIKKINESLSIHKSEEKMPIYILPENIDIYSKYIQNKNIFIRNILVIGSYADEKETMFILNTENQTVVKYEKRILMPIGEYKIYYLQPIFTLFNYKNDLPHTHKGDSYGVFTYNDIVIGNSICAENISPYIFSDNVKSGANILLNIASHSPFGNSDLLNRQTIAINTVRSIESGRSLITATNFGDSFISTENGTLSFKTNDGIRDGELNFYKVKVTTNYYKTPYVVLGDFIIIFFVYIILFVNIDNLKEMISKNLQRTKDIRNNY